MFNIFCKKYKIFYKILFEFKINFLILKHQQEVYNLTNEYNKNLSNKIDEYEEKIKNIENNKKKIIEEKDHTIKDNNKQINNLNNNVVNLESTVGNLQLDSEEKRKKIANLEAELAESDKNLNAIKSKYEALTENLEKEYNMKNVF